MIHIFYMNLSGDCSYEQSLALYRLLPEERKQKVKSAKQENVARKRLYTGAFLQYVLSKETGIPMENISYIYGSQGKPEMDCHNFYFNLSHSGKYAVLAVGDHPVGIDIEYKKRNYQSVAQRCFCKEEYEDIIEADTPQEQEKRFLQYWTMKEAFIKRSGEGLSVPLNSFRVIREDASLSHVEDQAVWFASIFQGTEPYCISLCSGHLQDVKAVIGQTRKLVKITVDEICSCIGSIGRTVELSEEKRSGEMQTREDVIRLCKTYKDVMEDYPFHDTNWTLMRHKKNKKAFALIYEREGNIWVNVKCDPEWRDFWRSAFESVVPAYHMNKEHWNSIILDGTVPDKDVIRMIEESYDLTKPKETKRKKDAS